MKLTHLLWLLMLCITRSFCAVSYSLDQWLVYLVKFLQLFQRGRVYNGCKLLQCPMDTPIKVNFTVPDVFYDSVPISANMTVLEKISGDLDFVVTGSKCTFDLKTCTKINNINVKGMCQKFTEKSAYFTNVFTSVHPQLDCPLLKNDYTLTTSILDLKFARIFAIEGFLITVTFKLVSTDKKARTKHTVLCVTMEVKVTTGRIG